MGSCGFVALREVFILLVENRARFVDEGTAVRGGKEQGRSSRPASGFRAASACFPAAERLSQAAGTSRLCRAPAHRVGGSVLPLQDDSVSHGRTPRSEARQARRSASERSDAEPSL